MAEKVADIGRLKTFAARESIFAEGEDCKGFYLVLSGAVKLFKLSADGREHVLHLVWPGETFAEASLFSGGSYPAHAEAIRLTRALLFPRAPFLTLLQDSPDVSMRLMGGMAMWLRRLVDQVEFLALKDASSRLAKYLEEEAVQDRVELQAPKSVVASHLGMSPETLSRLFYKLEGLGAIRVNGRTIEICDREQLGLVAQGEQVS